MKTLIAEDDFTSRLLLQELLKRYGPVHVAANGKEAVEAVRAALAKRERYDLVCMDIMMPEMDGQEALRRIRLLEKDAELPEHGRSRVVMTTALADRDNVVRAAEGQCDGFLVKPIEKEKLLHKLSQMGLRLDPRTKIWGLGG